MSKDADSKRLEPRLEAIAFVRRSDCYPNTEDIDFVIAYCYRLLADLALARAALVQISHVLDNGAFPKDWERVSKHLMQVAFECLKELDKS